MKIKLFFKLRKLCILFVLDILLLNAAILLGPDDSLLAIKTVIGQASLMNLDEKLLFITFLIIAQYYFSDTILYYIKNYDYILLRYNSKSHMFRMFFKELAADVLYFFAAFALAMFLSLSVRGASGIAHSAFLYLNLLGLVSFLCFFQAILVIKKKIETTILIILLLGILYTFITEFFSEMIYIDVSLTVVVIEHIFKIGRSAIINSMGFGLEIILNIAVFSVFKKIFMKEWQYYAN